MEYRLKNPSLFTNQYPLTTNSRLYFIADWAVLGDQIYNIVEQVCRAGAGIVQFRDKHATDEQFLKRARKLYGIIKTSGAIFILNDRINLLKEAKADGLHLGQADVPLKEARKILKHEIIGCSVHSVVEAKKAQFTGASYVACGCLFQTRTKYDTQKVTLKELKQVVDAVDSPVYGIGGINFSNTLDVLKMGTHGIVVCSAIACSDNVEQAVKKFLSLLK